MRFDFSDLLLLLLGGYWLFSSLKHGSAMARDDFGAIKRLHQDLGPSASNGAWWFKSCALGAIGAGWLLTLALRLGSSGFSALALKLAAASIVAEQLVMPLLTPRHWKSYTGVLVGVALAALLLGLDGVQVPWSMIFDERR